MINLQNVQSYFCKFTGETLENADNYMHFITIASDDITRRILPEITLSSEDIQRLEVATASYAYYLYSLTGNLDASNFRVGDISVTNPSNNMSASMIEHYLAVCSYLLKDEGEFMFEQVKK